VKLPRLLAVTLALLIGIAACADGAAPTPTPRDFTAVLESLALRGATIHQAVAGDSGCPTLPLHSNAVRLELTLQQDGEDYEIYLFRWRRPAHYEAAAETFDDCLEQYAAVSVAVNVDSIELAPWRAFGPGWSDELRTALAGALRAAGGSG
jgi:hypothetical protein